jgi:solute carrier family 25 (mitochondrial carnitine/acylcarnitine transporter), member 20/29
MVDGTKNESAVKAGVRDFLAGTFSGVAQVLVGHPFNTLKVRLQTSSRYKGGMDCFKTTMKEEGFRGLYKGIGPPLVS